MIEVLIAVAFLVGASLIGLTFWPEPIPARDIDIRIRAVFEGTEHLLKPLKGRSTGRTPIVGSLFGRWFLAEKSVPEWFDPQTGYLIED